MTLTPRTRKLVLAFHLVVSVGWIGAAMAYLALAVAVRLSDDTTTIRSAWTAMELVGWSVLVPVSIGTVVSGVVLALITTWGLLRHYWVVISLTLTVLATAVLLLHMPEVSELTASAQRADASGLEALGSDLGHTGLGLVVLFSILVLNVYKPRGLTRYGLRRQRERSRPLAAPH